MGELNVVAIIIIAGSVGIIGLLLVLWILSLRRIVPTNVVHIVQRTKKTVSYGKDQKAGNV